MSKNSLLITRPNHDLPTTYLCAWSEEIISTAKKKDWAIFDLKGSKAKFSQFQSYLNSRNPQLLIINGHGSPTSLLGQEDEELLTVGSDCTDVKGKIMYARSCDAAAQLGEHLFKNGLKCFIGYKRKFVFGYQKEKMARPKEDSIAKLFLEPSNLVAQTLIKGNSVGEAHQRSVKAMYRNFQSMLSTKATFEEKYYARFLWANMKNQKLIGNSSASL